MSDFESPPPPAQPQADQPAAVESSGAPRSPDWLIAQQQFQRTGRPKPRPKSSYGFQLRKGK